ncbi:MAG: hypothetical protein WCD63_18485, partial [Terrimicrobiaceae bacterium]
ARNDPKSRPPPDKAALCTRVTTDPRQLNRPRAAAITVKERAAINPLRAVRKTRIQVMLRRAGNIPTFRSNCPRPAGQLL